jgi:inner membrane protein
MQVNVFSRPKSVHQSLEPITHFLTGACLGRAGFNRKTALATATMTLAAEAPDLDVFSAFGRPAFGFGHHRGFTHSFLGSVLVSALVVGFMYLVWRIRGRKTKNNLPPRWGVLFGLAYLACLSHILLDFTNNYGVRPFWPISEKWFSWDIVFIIEPVLLVFLIGGLVAPSLFALINEEVGVHAKGLKGRAAAIIALVGVVLTWGVRDYEHRRAVNALDARIYEGADPLRVSAYPMFLNPFQWYGVVETQSFFATMMVDSSGPDVDPRGEMRIRYKPEETDITLAAKKSYMGRIYLDWAQYPITETNKLDNGGYIVHFKDLRFDYPGRTGRTTLGAGVELDANLKVVREFTGMRSRELTAKDVP